MNVVYEMSPREFQGTFVIIGRLWWGQWFDADRQKAIVWTNVDLDPRRHSDTGPKRVDSGSKTIAFGCEKNILIVYSQLSPSSPTMK